jgi:hypothetical protein
MFKIATLDSKLVVAVSTAKVNIIDHGMDDVFMLSDSTLCLSICCMYSTCFLSCSVSVTIHSVFSATLLLSITALFREPKARENLQLDQSR